jgi:hypothetical protein
MNFSHGNNGGRVRRKSSHNAIETRYRSSINERILELKEIVSDNDEKVRLVMFPSSNQFLFN